MKKPLGSQINVVSKGLGFWEQNLARVNIDIGAKEENLEFEKLGHLLNLLDFQFLSQQVLSRVVVQKYYAPI